ncbi:hypothetical protein BKA70DRAFT_1289948 [Coprinopsis sp. MPI-PUGE-AT-0042]|nr:hypothetical protein BKA70DRAFT_1289948 [Coprinopsis sp. MPI-PUGE-AT-0042]
MPTFGLCLNLASLAQFDALLISAPSLICLPVVWEALQVLCDVHLMLYFYPPRVSYPFLQGSNMGQVTNRQQVLHIS